MEKKLRCYRSSLVTNGIGIITFGLWSIIKFIMSMVMQPINFEDAANDEMADPAAKIIALIIVGAIVVIILAIIFAVHLYIGLSAYKEGINGKKGSFYLAVAVVMALAICLTMTLYFVPHDNTEGVTMSNIAAFFIDLTTVVILIDTIYAALMSRKLAKKLESEAE